ncbi:MAG: arsenate reductase ArsC [Candidatus Acididesulfobacter guangdongensis]|uniref:Arsenate reductase ArsC n=1 Tax=Acididesulfobacter guangdongensis TaxID=2597225 RepID=A0A519BJ07_ACIG2|nr:MAG: arsenate reductase ArsC [Candidatus Acididesulfobacter guangdongensis]
MNIIFICTGNSARSQMAEGFAKYYGEKYKIADLNVSSAGVNPKPVNPFAIAVMLEKNIDISRQKSKSMEVFDLNTFDYVITLCGDARDNCPLITSENIKLHWDLIDPAGIEGDNDDRLKAFRDIRDEIEKRVEALLKNQKN